MSAGPSTDQSKQDALNDYRRVLMQHREAEARVCVQVMFTKRISDFNINHGLTATRYKSFLIALN